MTPISGIRFPVAMPDAMQGVSPDISRPTIPVYELGKISPGPAQIGGVAPAGGSFESTLGNLVSEVSAKQTMAGKLNEAVLTGKNVPLHQAVIAGEEAMLSFQLMVEVRNKLLESYQELMRMQV